MLVQRQQHLVGEDGVIKQTVDLSGGSSGENLVPQIHKAVISVHVEAPAKGLHDAVPDRQTCGAELDEFQLPMITALRNPVAIGTGALDQKEISLPLAVELIADFQHALAGDGILQNADVVIGGTAVQATVLIVPHLILPTAHLLAQGGNKRIVGDGRIVYDIKRIGLHIDPFFNKAQRNHSLYKFYTDDNG